MMRGSSHAMTVRHRMLDQEREAAVNLLGSVHELCPQRSHYQSVTARGSVHRPKLLLRRLRHHRQRRPV
jgi:hypothetical protein